MHVILKTDKCAFKQCPQLQPFSQCQEGGGCNTNTGECIPITNVNERRRCLASGGQPGTCGSNGNCNGKWLWFMGCSET